MKIKIGAFLKKLGPGVITGASDDDPSGILTYLQAGVILKTAGLWIAFFTLPLMYAVQEMCGRIGFKTDKGIIEIVKNKYPKWVTLLVVSVSAIVIIINIGADLLAIGTVSEGLSGVSKVFWIPVLSTIIALATIFFSYKRFASVLKWLSLSLFCYIATVFFIKIDWVAALVATITPSISFSKEWIMIVSAIIGTTISPYLFFWEAKEEAEERDELTAKHPLRRFMVRRKEMSAIKADTFIGMAFSNIVMWFIILGASQLNSLYGVGEITSFDQAAMVLRPLLGNNAYLIFAIGVIGTGMLAIPVLAGSVGYIIAEACHWKEGINKKFTEAKGFYIAIAAATFIGSIIALSGGDPIKMLIYTAILYSIITPPLILMIMRIANDKGLMGNKKNGPLANIFGGAALVATSAAVIGYISSLAGFI
ncbi:MAG: divalent metal cation transporter [Candidatus Colwellbacteria bacterium]|nr:divalent metal cation transporter [Candidatus Colwellbacteria bacterium]